MLKKVGNQVCQDCVFKNSHCEERSDEAILLSVRLLRSARNDDKT
ncbi:MAG: hypothetical protein GQF41_0251 [Candidatus Rifleibacterium amylolyticum]|nr:MAG: hypothetical protein GQF41_0251 [Candidatus Rifleibacterium amylolyticum]